MFSEKKLFQALDPFVLLSEKIIVSKPTFTNKTREWSNKSPANKRHAGIVTGYF